MALALRWPFVWSRVGGLRPALTASPRQQLCSPRWLCGCGRCSACPVLACSCTSSLAAVASPVPKSSQTGWWDSGQHSYLWLCSWSLGTAITWEARRSLPVCRPQPGVPQTGFRRPCLLTPFHSVPPASQQPVCCYFGVLKQSDWSSGWAGTYLVAQVGLDPQRSPCSAS